MKNDQPHHGLAFLVKASNTSRKASPTDELGASNHCDASSDYIDIFDIDTLEFKERVHRSEVEGVAND